MNLRISVISRTAYHHPPPPTQETNYVGSKCCYDQEAENYDEASERVLEGGGTEDVVQEGGRGNSDSSLDFLRLTLSDLTPRPSFTKLLQIESDIVMASCWYGLTQDYDGKMVKIRIHHPR